MSPERPLQAPSTGRPRGRVLVVTPQPFFAERGTPIAVRYVLEALSRLGFEVDVLTLPIGADVRIPGVRIIRIANPLGIRSVPVGFSLRKLIFDAIMLVALVRRMRHRYVCVHAVEEAALLALLARVPAKTPLIYDMASSLPEQLAQQSIFRAAPVRAALRRIERLVLERAAAVVCSAGLAAGVQTTAPAARVREWRFPATRRAVDPAAVAAARHELAIAADAPVVLYSGNFASYQGVDLLLGAVAPVLRAVPRATFVFVGAADQAEIDRALAGLGDAARASIRCVVRQPRERIDLFLEMASVLVSPRAYGGNFPLKVFDYLAAGKPIVATDVPTHRVVLDDHLALLVEPSAAGCAAGIVRVLTEPPLAASLAAAAAQFAVHELSWPRFETLIDELYQQAMTVRQVPLPDAERGGVVTELADL